jgi:hypothetical protein
LANCGSFVLNTMFFDWTCQYGTSPGRPLIPGLLRWLLCSALYFGFMHTSGPRGPLSGLRQKRGERTICRATGGENFISEYG